MCAYLCVTELPSRDYTRISGFSAEVRVLARQPIIRCRAVAVRFGVREKNPEEWRRMRFAKRRWLPGNDGSVTGYRPGSSPFRPLQRECLDNRKSLA